MQALLVKITTQLLRFLSLDILYGLAKALNFILVRLIRYRQQVVWDNLKNAFPDKDDQQLQQIFYQFYQNFSEVVVESIKGFTLSRAALQSRFVYLNAEVFKPLFENGQSALLLGSHCCNWEWGVLSFPMAVQHQVVGIYKPLKNKPLEKYLLALRQKWGLCLADMSRTGRAVVENKDKPTIFVLIGDQTPSDIRHAHWVNFFHQDTPFLHGMDKLARQTGYPVYYYEIKRTKRGHYEVRFSELSHAPQSLAEGTITRQYAQRLEETIRHSPADWLWSHRRWKRKRPVPPDFSHAAG